MSKHTPGPWIAKEIKGGPPQSKFIIETPNSVVGPEAIPRWIADVHGTDMKYQERGQTAANAHLIAAAPELLDAAKWAVSLLREYMTHQEGKLSTGLRDAERIIAKAEGGE